MLVQKASDMFSVNSDALVQQMPIDHAMLETNKNNEPVIYKLGITRISVVAKIV